MPEYLQTCRMQSSGSNPIAELCELLMVVKNCSQIRKSIQMEIRTITRNTSQLVCESGARKQYILNCPVGSIPSNVFGECF